MRFLICLALILSVTPSRGKEVSEIDTRLIKSGELLCKSYFDSFVGQADKEQKAFLRDRKSSILKICQDNHFRASRQCSDDFLKAVEELAQGEELDQKKLSHMQNHFQPKLMACLERTNDQAKTDIQTLNQSSQR